MCSLFHHMICLDSGLAHFEELGISVVVCVGEIFIYTYEIYNRNLRAKNDGIQGT